MYHYDTEVIKQNLSLKNEIDLFKKKQTFINNELTDILWASRQCTCREHFYIIYSSPTKAEKLWNYALEVRNKYKEIFDLFDHEDNGYYNYCQFTGMVGGIRIMSDIFYDCQKIWVDRMWDDFYFEYEIDNEINLTFEEKQNIIFQDDLDKIFTMDLPIDHNSYNTLQYCEPINNEPSY